MSDIERIAKVMRNEGYAVSRISVQQEEDIVTLVFEIWQFKE